MRQADDLAARLEHDISARWGVARLGSISTALGGLDIEVGRRPERRRPVEALRMAPLLHSLDDHKVEHEQLDPDAGDVAEI
jgi:hypothetical protein